MKRAAKSSGAARDRRRKGGRRAAALETDRGKGSGGPAHVSPAVTVALAVATAAGKAGKTW